MELRLAFGTGVRHHRRAKRLTQEELGQLVGVTIETIGKIERGVVAPSFDTVERIARALDLSPLALFGAGPDAMPIGHRGQLLNLINSKLATMNEEQLRRVLKMLSAFMGD